MSKWWDKSITLIEGCTPVSAGCANCWSAGMACRFKPKLAGNGKFNGKVICRKDRLDEILKRKKPTRWTIWNDLFHKDVPFEFIDKVMAVIWESHCREKSHTYQILTKRHERMLEYFNSLPWKRVSPIIKSSYGRNWGAGKLAYPENLWLGISAENQEWWEKRKKAFFDTPAAIHFVSFEPLLGEIILSDEDLKQLDWVIVGAESNLAYPGRECKFKWLDSIREQCRVANVPAFFKQIPPVFGKKLLKKSEEIIHWGYPQQYPKGD